MHANRLSPLQVAERLAFSTGLTVEQIKLVLQAQAELAYAESARGFAIPGIGLLGATETQAREVKMLLGPRRGELVKVPAKRKISFRVSRLAKEMIAGGPQPMPDIFQPSPGEAFVISTDAAELSDPSPFARDLGGPFVLKRERTPAKVVFYRLTDLRLTTGRIVASDGLMMGGSKPFQRTVQPGLYALAIAIAQWKTDSRTALAIVRFSDRPIVKWEMALPEGSEPTNLNKDQFFSYSVDSGVGSFADAAMAKLVQQVNDEETEFGDELIDELKAKAEPPRRAVHVDSSQGSFVIFKSGFGDGSYASYFGIDDAGRAAALVTDFKIIEWAAVR